MQFLALLVAKHSVPMIMQNGKAAQMESESEQLRESEKSKSKKEKEKEMEREEGAGKTDAYCWKCCWLLWLFKKLNNCQLAKLSLSLAPTLSLSLPHSPSLLLYYCIFLVHFYGQSVESSPAQAVDHLPCKLEISMHISLSYSSYAAIWPTPRNPLHLPPLGLLPLFPRICPLKAPLPLSQCLCCGCCCTSSS